MEEKFLMWKNKIVPVSSIVIGGAVMVTFVLFGYLFFFGDDADVDIVGSEKRAEVAQEETMMRAGEDTDTDGETVGVKEEEDEEVRVEKPGTYEAYHTSKLAMAKDGKVVLFFRAAWCPTCRTLDADIRKHLSDIPADVTILDVDYDAYAKLKKQYGVTIQHTMVQVDASGSELGKWIGGTTLADVVSKIQ